MFCDSPGLIARGHSISPFEQIRRDKNFGRVKRQRACCCSPNKKRDSLGSTVSAQSRRVQQNSARSGFFYTFMFIFYSFVISFSSFFLLVRCLPFFSAVRPLHRHTSFHSRTSELVFMVVVVVFVVLVTKMKRFRSRSSYSTDVFVF